MNRVTTCGVKSLATMAALMGMALIASEAFAQENPKGPSCQEQLQEEKVRTYNLDQDRDNKEHAIAKIQAMAINLQQQNQQLLKQIADMKKAAEPVGEKKVE